jgi:hypothetical protein
MLDFPFRLQSTNAVRLSEGSLEPPTRPSKPPGYRNRPAVIQTSRRLIRIGGAPAVARRDLQPPGTERLAQAERLGFLA